MITAEQLKMMTSLTHHHIKDALGKKGKDYELTGSKFLGLTNGGEFCYHVVYKIDEKERDSTKVFIKYSPASGRVIASIG
jgi:hypothetical protein